MSNFEIFVPSLERLNNYPSLIQEQVSISIENFNKFKILKHKLRFDISIFIFQLISYNTKSLNVLTFKKATFKNPQVSSNYQYLI